ncbi:O-acetylhomoserine aminocarboxypropyltransferase [Citromicrobium bathyomarinum]|uniref:O-acetylhomoserine aminocarboxypropyltransferase n=1 Tax=unclassified Citromicrobium TaxID=2630544 RepID=UPI0006C8F576|nr:MULTISPECIES: O-acetylhomoserine aminocarboxypropyltransferase [unclassified Citromicrobium]KPM25242.1 O-acetylhomoserine aminocarboxypropyltransferase [Citromicrobium sp. RCC1885]KPM28483.1 O-acetylhomoserine aminocarboxypropyltransferase [Citromicrobium sp. RCC1878]MAO05669.1 O-acetylhomoserine aminocarboxypropyltransferase [Citromicrobium sp.]OAM09978.1 O-acetylhomoserine aminocarboxypropyltransferase [Citromicrobium sp. RCC1897]|tara:strand:- start:6451 stop:7743 length:1293 start_codon:yes stop_codon:yes gene_type:complete
MTDLHPETLAVHAGCEPDPTTNARITPIYQTASYVFDSPDHAANLFSLSEFGNIYSRIMNPTNDALEKKVAALEGGVGALGVASGHAAQLIAFHTLMEPGCNIVAAKKLYGGSLNQMGEAFLKFGWETRFVDADDPENIRAAMDNKTRCVFIESLANPGGVVSDISAIADVAHAGGVPLIVDNTMATPALCRPFDFGADIVTHSTTKFLNGHGNAVGGVIVDSGKFDWKAQGDKFASLTRPNGSYHGAVLVDALEPVGPIAFIIACRVLGLRDLGPALAPMNAFLALTGMETLHLRMDRHCDNALELAEWLKGHEKVAWVSYAGLRDSDYHSLANKYLGGRGGAVFTFGLKGGYEAGRALVSNVKLLSHLANIGDTRSLIIHPASTTHSQLGETELIAAGAGPDVVRVSVGIENIEDIKADLDQALAAAG